MDCKLTRAEMEILISFKDRIFCSVDPLSIADEMFNSGVLNKTQHQSIFGSLVKCERENTWNTLFVLLCTRCNINQIIVTLASGGYTRLALEISHKIRHIVPRNGSTLKMFNRTSCGDNERFAQKLFMSLKINTHNNVFDNPRQYCKDQACKYRFQLQQLSAHDPTKSQKTADRLTACLLGEIDSYIMLYDRGILEDKKELFDELELMIKRTSNSTVTELSFHSRLAIACAVAGKFEKGDLHINKAMTLSMLIGRCVEIPNFLYIYVFYLLGVYEHFPSKKNRDLIIHISEMGLQSVEYEEDPICRFWMRLFMLRMIYALLGLNFRGEPIPGIAVEESSIYRAKNLLSEVDRFWSDIETRRKIMYFVAKARISQLEQKKDYAESVIHYLNRAIAIGEEGHYGETQFIKKYRESFTYINAFQFVDSSMASNESKEVCNRGSSTSFRIISRSPLEHDEEENTDLKIVGAGISSDDRVSSEGKEVCNSGSSTSFEIISHASLELDKEENTDLIIVGAGINDSSRHQNVEFVHHKISLENNMKIKNNLTPMTVRDSLDMEDMTFNDLDFESLNLSSESLNTSDAVIGYNREGNTKEELRQNDKSEAPMIKLHKRSKLV